ncbi:MAG: lipocalin family protein [Chitinispirillaceae bacterium]
MGRLVKGKSPLVVAFLIMLGYMGAAEAVEVVKDVDLEQYSGTWYEIARIPNKHQKDLVEVTSTFKPLGKGKYTLVNKGFKGSRKGEKKVLKSKVEIDDRNKTGDMKLRVYRFFTLGYKVIDLDKENYEYALVTSDSKDYLWVLSKTPVMDEHDYNRMVLSAREKGFDVGRLERVPQKTNIALANAASD